MTQMPVNSPSLPGIRQPLLEGTSASRPYYLFLQWVATNLSSLSATVDDLSAQQGGISISPDANVTGQNSIKTRGTLSEGVVQVSLQDDVAVVGNTQYYGSDSTGAKGWFSISAALASSSNVVPTTATDGITTFDLTDVTVGAGGSLKKYGFDAKGRLNAEEATTTDDLTEGSSNLYFTGARVLATVLAGLSTATRAVITAADTVLSALGKLQAQITGNAAIPAGYIDGLKMAWNSATSISVTGGACYIQASSAIVSFPSTLTLSSLSLTASTWYHLYGYLNAGTPAIELVTTAPAAPYSGTARSKTGDTSRRYLGSMATDASANIIQFVHKRDDVYYQNVGANFRVLSGGTATVSTSISCAAFIPVTAVTGKVRLQNNGLANAVFLTPGGIAAASTSYYMSGPNNGVISQELGDVPVGPSQTFNYINSAAGGSSFLDVLGYTYER